MKTLKEISRIFLTKELLIFLLLINTALHYMNFRFETVDLPNATKKLVIDTIKDEITFNTKCVHQNCKKEVRSLENVLDEISYASQLGRLDAVSLLLAVFALVLGFGAVAGFLHIKENAERTAKETSREVAENYFKKENDRELREEANSTKEKSQRKGVAQNNKTVSESDYSATNKNKII